MVRKTYLGFAKMFCVFVFFALFLVGCSLENQNVACTLEAKVCPDGSTVGRVGPNCEFAACPSSNSQVGGEGDDIGLDTDEELKKFSSKDEFLDFVMKNQVEALNSLMGYDSFARGGIVDFGGDIAVEEAAVFSSDDLDSGASKTVVYNTQNGAEEFSTTNVQVEGVDEADIVKNDNKYIYTLSQNRLVIVDAYPAKDGKVLSKVEFEGSPQEMFLDGDKVFVIVNSYESQMRISEYDFIPRPFRNQVTKLLVYDVNNREKPELLKNYSIEGNYFDARMTGGFVYLISKKYGYDMFYDFEMPVLREAGDDVVSSEIYCFGNCFDSNTFNTIASFDVSNLENVDMKTFMLGYSDTLYVSEKNMYIAYQKNYPYYKEANLDRFFGAVYPLLSKTVQGEVDLVKKDDDLSYSEKMEKISSVLEKMYNEMDEKSKEDLTEKIYIALREYDQKISIERDKSVVQKISISKGKIDYLGKTEFKGHLLNQFSLDENSDGELRVATTNSYWIQGEGSKSFNNVIVFDSDLKEIGKLENLAEDERIYSTRFMGDKLYMVTFRQVDPLFVIDLSDSSNLKVLGQLKIPGFSDYLHPYDENHLIGIGKDTKESEWGGVVTNGVKISLFDISDFENPKEVDNYVISGRYTDTIVSREHKALLFDKDKNIMVIPVREYVGEESNYRYRYQQGAYVFSFDDDLKIELKGKVYHDDNEVGYSYWYDSPSAILRSLYMGNVLYTVSEKKILANEISDLDKINEFDLGYVENKYNDYEYYY